MQCSGIDVELGRDLTMGALVVIRQGLNMRKLSIFVFSGLILVQWITIADANGATSLQEAF